MWQKIFSCFVYINIYVVLTARELLELGELPSEAVGV